MVNLPYPSDLRVCASTPKFPPHSPQLADDCLLAPLLVTALNYSTVR